jgi:hypothetical protein
MLSKAEIITSQALRSILVELPIGSTIDDSEKLQLALSGLEWFVSEVLREIHPEWNESLDAIYPHYARKSGEREVEILGLCYLLSDHTMASIDLRLQLFRATDAVSWLELRLGEKGENGMVRLPYGSNVSIYKRLHDLNRRAENIDWVYKVTFGKKEVES